MEQDTVSIEAAPQISKPRKKRRRMIIWISSIVIAVLALAAGGVLWALRSAQNETFPELPDNPEAGTWYGVYPEGAQSALGEPYHGIFRLGTSNNVMVLFNGGGVSVNAETADNPEDFFNTDTRGDVIARLSLGSENEGTCSRTGQSSISPTPPATSTPAPATSPSRPPTASPAPSITPVTRTSTS